MSGEAFQLDGCDAFVILPASAGTEIPWVWYAPTLPGLPAQSEVWMFKQFLAKGIAIAGIDAGESYGSRKGTELYDKFYSYLVNERAFGKQPCLLARSRGGLMLYSWAVQRPGNVAGIAGIYPVCNLASYPGIAKAAEAFGMTKQELAAELPKYNPIDRLQPLAEARVPILHIHGDRDQVVPLEGNSAELARRYRQLGGSIAIEVITGQGHNMWEGWFQSERLTEFAIARALGQPMEDTKPAGAKPR